MGTLYFLTFVAIAAIAVKIFPAKGPLEQFAHRYDLSFRWRANDLLGTATGQYRGYALDIRQDAHAYYFTLRRPSPVPPAVDLPLSTEREQAAIREQLRHIQTSLATLQADHIAKLSAGDETIGWMVTGLKNEGRVQVVADGLIAIFEAYARLRQVGGAAIPALTPYVTRDNANAVTHVLPQGKLMRDIATGLIQSIGRDTTALYGHQQVQPVCQRCLTRLTKQKVNLPGLGNSAVFYGCRVCRQSRETYPAVWAVLDNTSGEELTGDAHQTRINWLVRRRPFDFDRVEIINATDEEVERFAVQAGNDTDAFRRGRYAKITCTIAPKCELSPNTLRILERTFGEVNRLG